ncbi:MULTISPECIES: virulence RhuM family protein [Bacteroides]|uniref:DNA-binding protein n=1 Tax=Bacteroides uniformis TaxID=820 RepID=A0A174SBG0_BACUN|nr:MULTISPECIES: virulence RhuM family protein [Bacteroides]CUP93671.1 DNA-binding protein [Bacteroides uniformis]
MERGYIKITEEEIGKPVVEVKIVNGTVWMFKHELARLFDVYLQTVGNNFRSIFKTGLLREEVVTMELKLKNERGNDIYVTYYNLEAIIFLSYRIDSRYAKAFREWVMNALCEYNRMEKKPQEMLIVFSQGKSQSYICN